MASTATVTSKTGPAVTVTSLALTGVTSFLTETYPRNYMRIVCTQGNLEFDINATTTYTVTISGGNCTITISQ